MPSWHVKTTRCGSLKSPFAIVVIYIYLVLMQNAEKTQTLTKRPSFLGKIHPFSGCHWFRDCSQVSPDTMSTCASNFTSDTHKGTCSELGMRGILQISNLFFSFLPSNPRNYQKFWAWLSYTADKWVLCKMAVMARTRRCCARGDFSLTSESCQDTKSICLPLVHCCYIFFPGVTANFTRCRKSTLIKAKKRGSTLLVWFVLNTERINI